MSVENFEKTWQRFDDNNDGEINYTEFVAAECERGLTKQKKHKNHVESKGVHEQNKEKKAAQFQAGEIDASVTVLEPGAYMIVFKAGDDVDVQLPDGDVITHAGYGVTGHFKDVTSKIVKECLDQRTFRLVAKGGMGVIVDCLPDPTTCSGHRGAIAKPDSLFRLHVLLLKPEPRENFGNPTVISRKIAVGAAYRPD